jgi:putative salt-induced outer membrane protein YdiY
VTSGNSDTANVNATLSTVRKWTRDEFMANAFLNYGTTDDEVTASQEGGSVQYNRLFSERFYGFARVDVLHDDVADLAYRVMPSIGAGYYFIKDEKFTLNGEVGPGYVWEKYFSESRDEYASIRFGEKFTWQISKAARFWQGFEYTPQVTDFGNYQLFFEAGIATKIAGNLDLRLVVTDIYRSEPAPGKENNDFTLAAGIGYTL